MSVSSESHKKPLIIIAGPTAAGKTNLSVKLAQKIGGEIISADSMQVYRHMDIGSAKITQEEMQMIPHYGIDCLSPFEDYNVQIFQTLAKTALNQIYEHGTIPIVAGGTGFYIQALLYDIEFTEHSKLDGYRKELETKAQTEEGIHELYGMLKRVDPASCALIHENNVKRVIRALEYYHETGRPISTHNEEQKQKESPYDFRYFVITDERQALYERIDKRVDLMLQNGLVEEVQRLKEMGLNRSYVSMQGIGYKEILAYLDGEISLEEAVYIVKRDTRHFAKRQLTWFRRQPDVIWIDRNILGSEEAMLEKMMQMLPDRKLSEI